MIELDSAIFTLQLRKAFFSLAPDPVHIPDTLIELYRLWALPPSGSKSHRAAYPTQLLENESTFVVYLYKIESSFRIQVWTMRKSRQTAKVTASKLGRCSPLLLEHCTKLDQFVQLRNSSRGRQSRNEKEVWIERSFCRSS